MFLLLVSRLRGNDGFNGKSGAIEEQLRFLGLTRRIFFT
jgi:hypothetical protein